MKRKICMVIPSFSAKGGITSVASGYLHSSLIQENDVKFVETYCDGNKIKKVFYAIKGYCEFLTIIATWHPEIVHVHSSFGGSFYRKLFIIRVSNFFNVPVINHIHGAEFEEFYKNASSRKKKIIKKIYNSCSAIIALSEEWKNNLKEIVPEDKIVVIENYSIINEQAIKNRKNKANYHTVLFLGFLCKRKGCYDIPAVVEIVKKKIPNVRFVLAGSGEKEQICSIIDDSIKDNIIFPGWIKDEEKQQELSNCDVFFLPSYNEGMPMSILDAMGYGLPIISTFVGGIPKIVKDGYNGFLLYPGDIQGMADAIIRLLSDDEEREKMGMNSVYVINNGFSLLNHINKIEELYDRCLHNG